MLSRRLQTCPLALLFVAEDTENKFRAVRELLVENHYEILMVEAGAEKICKAHLNPRCWTETNWIIDDAKQAKRILNLWTFYWNILKTVARTSKTRCPFWIQLSIESSLWNSSRTLLMSRILVAYSSKRWWPTSGWSRKLPNVFVRFCEYDACREQKNRFLGNCQRFLWDFVSCVNEDIPESVSSHLGQFLQVEARALATWLLNIWTDSKVRTA